MALIGQTDPEPILKCAFVNGLPAHTSMQLKSLAAVEDLSLHELVARARMILSVSSQNGTSGPCAAGKVMMKKDSSITCYNCGGKGHISRECTSKNRSAFKKQIVCFQCGEAGHTKYQCRKLKGGENENSGNE